jgi:hypothetical protein
VSCEEEFGVDQPAEWQNNRRICSLRDDLFSAKMRQSRRITKRFGKVAVTRMNGGKSAERHLPEANAE